MEKVKPLKVVSCPYYPMQSKDITVNKVTGIFVVIYSEDKDSDFVVPLNVKALKVTTSRPYTNMYVSVDDKTILTYNNTTSTFKFREESYILAHEIVLPICNCTVLGELSVEDSIRVLKLISLSKQKEINQICNEIEFNINNKA